MSARRKAKGGAALAAAAVLAGLLAAPARADPSSLAGSWVIRGEDGSTRGTLELTSPAASGPRLAGSLRVWLSMGGSMADEGPLRLRRATAGAVDLGMQSAHDDTGYRLLLAVPAPGGREVAGSMFDGDTLVPVRLSRTGGAEGPAPQPAPPEDDFVTDEMELYDLPGVGVSGPAYRLTGVPAGRRLAVRDAPDREAAIVGTLDADATEILVVGCEPQVEAYVYEMADDAGRRRILDSSWCDIRVDGVAGHIPGRYLDPIVR